MFKNVQKKLNSKRGFSLIELIVVIAIIGILVMLAAPRFLGYTKDAEVAAMKADVKILSDASLLYHIDEEAFPTTGAAAIDTSTNYAALHAELAGDDVVWAIDSAELADYVKGLSNGYAAYGIVTAGTHEGEVVHLAGVDDKAGDIWFGTQLSNK